MIRLLLFGTPGCHLCEQAEQILNDCLANNLELTIEAIDIAEQEQWQEQYAIRIPVLYHLETKKERLARLNDACSQAVQINAGIVSASWLTPTGDIDFYKFHVHPRSVGECLCLAAGFTNRAANKA